jgi:hypothetical protein
MTQYRLKRLYNGEYHLQYKRGWFWRTYKNWDGRVAYFSYEQALIKVAMMKNADARNLAKKNHVPVYIDEPFPESDPYAPTE